MNDLVAPRGMALALDRAGRLLRALSDPLGLARPLRPGQPFITLVEPGSTGQAQAFLETLDRQERAPGLDLALSIDGQVLRMHFVGGRRAETLFLLAAASAEEIARYFDWLLQQDQAGADDLLAALKDLPLPIRREERPAPEAGMDATCRLDELAALQRELARATTNLQRSQLLARRILDASPHLIYIYDLRTRRSVFSSRALAGILGDAPAETVSPDSTWIDRQVHSGDLPALAAHLERLLAVEDGQVLEFEYRVPAADGTWHTLHSRETPFNRAPGGRPRQILGLAEDVTADKQAEMHRIELARDLERSHREIALLSQLAGRLQASRSLLEAYPAFLDPLERLFPRTSGALYVRSPDTGQMEAAVTWGQPSGRLAFSPEECWATVSQQVQAGASGPGGFPAVETGGAYLCPHIQPDRDTAGLPQTESLCVPVLAHSELLGVLHFQVEPEETQAGSRPSLDQRLALAAARTLGLGLANLKLGEALRLQSIRDPLTGLFNRRYMEETLDRELSRAARGLSTLGVILLDLDHFQRFYDAHGYAAADALLQALGGILQSSVRAEDIACRYGGDEFLLILPDSTLKITVQRARQIQEKVRRLAVESAGRALGGLTASFGVAFFPTHGGSGAELIRAAGRALERAKAEGGDRAAVSEIG